MHRGERLLWLGALGAVVLQAYAPVLSTGFSDADGLADVAWAGRPLGDQLFVPLTGGVGGDNANFWRPAAMLHFWLQRRLFGLDATAWHAWDLGLHFLATALAGEWAARAGRLLGAPERGLRWGAALLYAAHPLGAEVVPATARNLDLLLAVGVFGALYALTVAEDRRRAGAPPGAAPGLAAAAALLALGAKDSAVLLVPIVAAGVGLFRVDLPPRARTGLAFRLVVPALGVLAVWAAARAWVLDGIGGYFADGEPFRWSRVGWALARGFVEPLVPSLSTALGTSPPAFAPALPLVIGAALALGVRRAPARRLGWLALGAWALFIVLFGVTGVYTRRVLYVPVGFACVLGAVLLDDLVRRRDALLGLAALAWGASFVHGTPVVRPYLDWSRVTDAGEALAAAVVDLDLPPKARVWLVDRPYRASVDPRGFRLWSPSRSLVHGPTTYALEAWRSDRRPDLPLDLRTLTRWEMLEPATPAEVRVEGQTLVIRRTGGARKLSASRDVEVAEVDGELRLTPRVRTTLLVWDPAGTRPYTLGSHPRPSGAVDAEAPLSPDD